jgi:hypothetical protein
LIPVRFVEAVKDDLAALPSDRLRKVALQWMMRLRSDPYLGQRLTWRRGADLSGCRKIYFDYEDEPLKENFVFNRRPGGPRFRIVYRLLPRPEHPEVVRILAVGPKIRTDGGVYHDAGERQ